MAKLIDITGQRFGKLKVIQRAGTTSWGRPSWLCICDCGKTKVVAGSNLRKGNTTSCGCNYANSGMPPIHGDSIRGGTTYNKFYAAWMNMKRRCKTNLYYTGKGIKVCPEWDEYLRFKEDMYEEYIEHVSKYGEKQTTLDRIDSNGNYQYSNCRWTTYSGQHHS